MKKALVFDTSTLILLAKATILRNFAGFNRITITKEIISEVFSKEGAEDAKIIKKLIAEGRIIEDIAPDTDLGIDFMLGEGEAKALSFALKRKIILATDDLRAIRACKVLDVRFITAIHCLISLYNNKAIDQRLALEKLKTLEKYGRYSASIIRDARRIIEGGKNG
ncbi:hypothetical protein HYU11_00295 [Candidatus Woesearchaeota archaeon]|nr:hypothetical protein [Candidatus Woesearchaeota archaeon]